LFKQVCCGRLFVVCEVEVCPECGSSSVLDDGEHGEKVCIACGLVLGLSEFTLPQDHTVKAAPVSPIAYTSSAVGVECDSSQRTERQVSYDISWVIQKLELPRNLEVFAVLYARKILREAKHHNPRKFRLTCQELTIASVWKQIKQSKQPLSADEYVRRLEQLYKKRVNLIKIGKRVNYFVKNKNHLADVALISGHVNRIAAKLVDACLIDVAYAHGISVYAIQMVNANFGVASNRKANLTAAGALLAADQLLACRLQLQPLAWAANTGTGNLTPIAKAYKKYAPPLPDECAAVKFVSYLQKEVNIC